MTESKDNWHSCGGEVRDLVAHLADQTSSQRRKRHVLASLSAVTLILLAITAFGLAPSAGREALPISCASIRDQAEQIVAGTLDGETQQRVDAHLAYCRSCRTHIEQARAALTHSQDLSFIALACR